MLSDGKLTYQLIQKIAVFYVAIWSISPPMMIGDMYRLLALVCVAIWFVLAMARGFMLKPVHCIALLFVLAVAGIAYIQYNSIKGVLKMIPIYMLVIGFLMAHFYRGRWHELTGLIPCLLLLLAMWNMNTIIALLDDPEIARRIVRDDEEIYQYLARGIGGYELIYPQVCVWPAVAMWSIQAFRKNRVFMGVIGLVWAVPYIWLLFLAGYSIAICATFLGLILLVLYKGKNVYGALIIAIVLFVGGALILLYVEPVRNWLLTVFDGTAVAKKINDWVATDATGTSVGSINDRVERYMYTLSSLVNYPAVGSLWLQVSGGHSAILDNFVKYGWWGGGIYTVMLLYTPREYKKKMDNPVMRRAANAVLVGVIFVALLDSVTYSFAFMLTVVLSLLYENIAEWGKKPSRPRKMKQDPNDLYFRQRMKAERAETRRHHHGHHRHHHRESD